MSSANTKQSAEQRFRAAFERLKLDKPDVLPKGTAVSQNNVAKEAGCDPSALKKSRFPSLVAEIQHYVKLHKEGASESKQQATKKKCKSNREVKDLIADLKKQRDKTAGLLADANLRIIELSEEVKDLRLKLEETRPSATISFPMRGV